MLSLNKRGSLAAIGLLMASGLAACGGRSVGDSEASSGSEATQATGSASDAATATVTDASSSDIESTSTDASASAEGEEGSVDLPEGECTDPDFTRVNFWFDEFTEFESVNLTARCGVASVNPGFEGGWFISLTQCDDGSGVLQDYNLVLDTSPSTAPLLQPGFLVNLRYVQRSSFGPAEKWLAISADGVTELRVGAMRANSFPDADPDSPWHVSFAPLRLESVSIGCTPEDTDGCGDVERRGLGVQWQDDATVAPDHSTGFVGPLVSYEVITATFTEVTVLTCDDYPERVYEAAFFLIPEG